MQARRRLAAVRPSLSSSRCTALLKCLEASRCRVATKQETHTPCKPACTTTQAVGPSHAQRDTISLLRSYLIAVAKGFDTSGRYLTSASWSRHTCTETLHMTQTVRLAGLQYCSVLLQLDYQNNDCAVQHFSVLLKPDYQNTSD